MYTNGTTLPPDGVGDGEEWEIWLYKPFDELAIVEPLQLSIALLYTEASVQIYKTNRFVLEPIHIFELNTDVNQALKFLAELLRREASKCN